jgi:ABC-type phosphate transport system substrate-binding protein
MRYLMHALLLAGLGLAVAPASADLAVIVSARSPIQTLRPDEVADIFLGKVSRSASGVEVVPVDQALSSTLRGDFYAKVVGKPPALLKAHWSKMIFTGRGHPPRELPNNRSVRREVAQNPLAIGYVDSSELDPSVRAVLLVPCAGALGASAYPAAMRSSSLWWRCCSSITSSESSRLSALNSGADGSRRRGRLTSRSRLTVPGR